MADLIDPTSFDFFARYFLAGFIIIYFRSLFVVGGTANLSDSLIQAVILSLVNQLIFQIIISTFSTIAAPVIASVPRAVFFAEVLFLPTVIGLLVGWSLSTSWNLSLLRWLSIPIRHPARRAYDFAFTRDETDRFMILTYADGTTVYAYFGENSFASTDGNRSDIYFERIYDVASDGQWAEKVPSRGALLSLQDLRSIEFLEPERTTNG